MSLESVGSLQRVKVGTLPVPSEVSAPFGARHVVFWHVDDQRVQVRPFHEVGRVDRIEEGTWIPPETMPYREAAPRRTSRAGQDVR